MEPFKSADRLIAADLAALLSSPTGSRILALQDALGEAVEVSVRTAASTEPATLEDIGIWRRDGAVWNRDSSKKDQWAAWADLPSFPHRIKGKRAVLVGESVARGYLYDPAYTPADVLQAILDSSGAEIAVLDLARTNQTAGGIVETVEASMALKPDFLIVYGGNNWTVRDDPTSRWVLGSIFRSSHFGDFRSRHLSELLAPLYRRTIEGILAVASSNNVGVIVVVPDFNLFDWQEEQGVLSPILPGDDWHLWYDSFLAAGSALEDSDLITAALCAERMIGLDRGTNHHGHRILAAVAIAKGEIEAARAHLERARDSVVGTCQRAAPRCPSTLQDTLRAAARAHGASVVDVPAIHSSTGGISGSAEYLDYCHHTSSSIRTVMAHVAVELSKLDRRAADYEALLKYAPSPDPETEARASVHAAVHNSRWRQSPEVIRRFLSSALGSDAAIALMRGVRRWNNQTGFPWMYPDFTTACEHPASYRYFHSIRSGLRPRHFPEHELAKEIDQLCGRNTPNHSDDQHGLELERIDLTARQFRKWPLAEILANAPNKLVVDIHSPELKFQFIWAQQSSEITICARAASEAFEGSASLELNGSVVLEFALSNDWRTVCHALRPLDFTPELNEIVLKLPVGAAEMHRARDEQGSAIEKNFFIIAQPKFGQLSLLTLQPCS